VHTQQNKTSKTTDQTFLFNLQTPMSSYEKVHNLFKFASDIVKCDNLNVTKSNKVEVYFVLVVERRTCTHKIAEIRKVRGYIDVPTQFLYNGQQIKTSNNFLANHILFLIKQCLQNDILLYNVSIVLLNKVVSYINRMFLFCSVFGLLFLLREPCVNIYIYIYILTSLLVF
jgi:hypothetical protein